MNKICIVSKNILSHNSAVSIRLQSFISVWSKECNITLITDTDGEVDHNINLISMNLKNNQKNILFRIINEIQFNLFVKKNLKDNYDAIIFSVPPFFLLLLLYFLRKQTKWILDVRDLYPDVFFSLNIIRSKSLVGSMLKKIEKRVYFKSDIIFTVTDNLQKKIASRTDSNIFLVPNGNQQISESPPKMNPENIKLIFHGTLGRFQDINMLIEYAKYLKKNKLNSYSIKIIGSGKKEEYLKNMIEMYNLDHIEYSKIINNDLIFDEIISSHIGLSFRIKNEISKDSFPVKVYEYMAGGLPVVITPHSEAGDFVSKEGIGFQIEPGNVEILHSCVKNIVENYIEMSNKALVISKRFERKNIASDAFKIINN